jgi:hypothetical protein
MSKTIKTRNVVKDIKALDKREAGLAAVKSAHAKTKEVADRSEPPDQQYRHGNDYAQDKSEQAGKAGAEAAGRGAVKGTEKTVDVARDAKNAIKGARHGAQGARPAAQGSQRAATAARQQAAQTASKQTAQRAATRTAATTRQAATTSGKAASTTGRAAKDTIKQGAKSTVKTAAKGVKTASATAGKAVKTTQQAAHASKAAAKATGIAAHRAAQAARAASKAAAIAAKAAAKSVAAFAKMAIAAVKSLAAAIAAGGWVAVAVILIICLVGLIAASAYGIFFAGGDMGDGTPTLRAVVAEVNQEHQDEIDRIRADSPHDELMVTGTRAPWREVLAIYTVRTATNPDDPLDTVTMDERRQQLLRDIYWDMNSIDHRVEDRQFEEIIAVEQADGTIVEETQVYTRRTLYITQSAKTAEEMADFYNFTPAQRELLAELLSTRYVSAWQSVLYGTHAGSGDIVEVAASQLGNPGGAPYWSWYGYSSRVEWCACFVSWCANECGYIEAGLAPKFSWCQAGIAWFSDAGQYQPQGTGYVPQPGDIIFFEWGDGYPSDHVGIVESCDGSIVYTIEGNSSDAVNRRSYNINSSAILGYGQIIK